MASPPIVSNTAGYNPVTNPAAPTTTVAGATWRGVPPWASVPYPTIPNLLWQAKHQGVFSLIERVPPSDPRFARGPRFSPRRGTVDVWVTAPAAGSIRSFLQFGAAGVTSSTAFLALGVTAANRVTFVMRDRSGVAVVTATDATVGALGVTQRTHIVCSWDADAGTASLTINGVAVPAGDFSVDPDGTAWEPGTPVEANLDRDAWAGSIHLVQVGGP